MSGLSFPDDEEPKKRPQQLNEKDTDPTRATRGPTPPPPPPQPNSEDCEVSDVAAVAGEDTDQSQSLTSSPGLPFSKARCIALVATLTGASFLNVSRVLGSLISIVLSRGVAH
jgi:hypothetical protein